MSDNNTWYRVTDIPIEQNLSPFITFLRHQGVVVHITEEAGKQRVWVNQDQQCSQVAEWISQWNSGELVLESSPSSGNRMLVESSLKARRSSDQFLRALSTYPVTISCIVLGIIGALLVETANNHSIALWLLFQSVDGQQFLSLEQTLSLGEYWRLITPIFLHFGLMHIVFNSLILWEFGRRIEHSKGALHLLLILFIAAVVSNTAQYILSPNTAFGGNK